MTMVKLMSPKIDLFGKPCKSRPHYFESSHVVEIRPQGGGGEGSVIITAHESNNCSFVRESPALAHRKLFVDPAAKAKAEVDTFLKKVGLAASDSDATA